ncbi:YaaC family protein [Maribacter dokdonensis]
MSRQFESGIKATYKHQGVKYFPFNSEPGTSYVLTSDPWAYLRAWIDQQINSTQGDKKKRLTKAKYFAEQAESFQIAAEKTRLPTKATLTYYSLLNLTKGFLSVKGLELEKKEESHGISLGNNSDELTVLGPLKNCTNIFLEFSKHLGKPIQGKHKVNISDVICDIPEIHELGFTLGKISQRKYLPVTIDFLTNDDKTKIFTELSFRKENDARLQIEKFYKNNRKKYFKLRDTEENGDSIYRSIKRKNYTHDNFPRIYKNICKEYKELDISILLTRDGYKYYVNLKPNAYHQLANLLMMAFYMGSLARYRPTKTQEILGGEMYPLITEIIDTCPRQFLYKIVSLTTESVCAVPKAKI